MVRFFKRLDRNQAEDEEAGDMADYFFGVDVGTDSARAGLFDAGGALLGSDAHAIRTSRPRQDFVEQDSEDIWHAVCTAVRGAVAASGVAAGEVRGIGFDATCSLVIRDRSMKPLNVSPDAAPNWDTIVWMDHRAKAEAEECSRSGESVLDYIGGVMSPEMETPKLMWLKRHHPDAWARIGAAFDLCDFLSWRATGDDRRSVCAVTCKWTYLAHETEPWSRSYLRRIGLEDLSEKTGADDNMLPVGAAVGRLSEAAAEELGLTADCIVGAGLIDAHAGALGTLGAHLDASLDGRLAVIAGTSTCTMGLAPEARFIKGIWGPYSGAVVDGWWLNEGGQSISGALFDYILELHPAARDLGGEAHRTLSQRIMEIYEAGQDPAPRLHVLPDFHGNRSPLADAEALGVISGLSTDLSDESLVHLYWATACAVAYGLRHIIEHMNAQGYTIDTLHLSGGHAASPFLRKLYADATGCSVVLSGNAEPVLLGSAMVAATAAGTYASLAEAGKTMATDGLTLEANKTARLLHNGRYAAFLQMHEHRREIDRMTQLDA